MWVVRENSGRKAEEEEEDLYVCHFSQSTTYLWALRVCVFIPETEGQQCHDPALTDSRTQDRPVTT